MKFAYRSFLSIVAMMVWGVSLSHAGIYNVKNPTELQSALDRAVAGDEIVLADGSYSGKFYIRNNAGTSSNPITVRAASKHKAVMQGNNACDRFAEGFVIQREHWVIKDLRFRNHGRSIMVQASNVEIHNNIIEHARVEGIRGDSGIRGLNVHNNMIANVDSCDQRYDGGGITLINNGLDTAGVSNSRIVDNIIYATGDNGYQAVNPKLGYGLLIANNSNDNLIQGNLLLANGGKGILRILAGSGVASADRNMVRDNIVIFGDGGVSSDDCSEDSNQFINNIVYGNYHSTLSTKGNKDGTKGRHKFRHNLLYTTDFSRLNAASGNGGCGGIKNDNVFKDNIVYQSYQPSQNHVLMYIDNEAFTLKDPGFNVFWAPGSSSSWFRNYTLRSTDITSQPIFVNPAEGDFSLASGSPGKGAASDGKDIGIEYNTHLKKSWLTNVFTLPTQRKDNLSTSASFTVNPSKYYQVWFYIPESSPYQGIETFNVEGQSLQRDIKLLTTGAIWVQPGGPARWITLGRHRAQDGTLNMSWSNTNSASKIFIRELPTPNEAYQWIAQSQSRSDPLQAPANLRVVQNP